MSWLDTPAHDWREPGDPIPVRPRRAGQELFAAWDEAVDWDEALHPRDEQGRFAESGGGAGGRPRVEVEHVREPSLSPGPKLPRRPPTPGDLEKFHALKDQYSHANHELLAVLKHKGPQAAEAHEKADEVRDLVKQMFKLNCDPGGLEGIGLPGGPRDLLVIGAGPAGMAAAIGAGYEGLDTLMIEAQERVGGQMKYSGRIENEPGFPVGVSGRALAERLHEQVEHVGSEVRYGVRAVKLETDPDGMKRVTLSTGEVIEARAVVIAGGLEFRELPNLPQSETTVYGDADSLAARNVGKPVVIVGGANSGGQAALSCALTAEHVYLLAKHPIKETMSRILVDAITAQPEKITVIEGEEAGSHSPEARVLKTTKGREVPAQAVGVFIGAAPRAKWLPQEIPLRDGKVVASADDQEDEHGHITRLALETPVPGVFAAGDIRRHGGGRVVVASGEGGLVAKNLFLYYQRERERGRLHG